MQTKKLKRVVSIFIFKNNRVLLQLRDENKKISFPGQWGVISGEISVNDSSPLEAAKREIKEELSISKIKDLKFVETFLDRKNENILHYVFRLQMEFDQKIVLNEGIEFSFFSKQEFNKGIKFSKLLMKNSKVVNILFMKKFFFKLVI